MKEVHVGIKEVFKEIMDDVLDEASHQVSQGAHEMAAALLGGSDGFVMYPRSEQQQEDEKPQPPPQVEAQQDMGMEL
jgi:hypothetical protein